MTSQKPSISIIGFGRFGKVWAQMLSTQCEVTIYSHPAQSIPNTYNKANTIKEAYKNKIIFYAVPIDQFASVISEHATYIDKDHLLIDVLSVKEFPEKIFKAHVRQSGARYMLTHPMFGPDSINYINDSKSDLPIVISRGNTTKSEYLLWKKIFLSLKLHVIEMSAKEHDKLAARSQGLTHFIGRMLKDFGIAKSPIDTNGMRLLLSLTHNTCNDTWQLFENLQHFNKYTKDMRIQLGSSIDRLYGKLLPKRINHKFIIYGIQGGIGSFNEQAIRAHLSDTKDEFKIKHLYTTANVLKALEHGDIDYGQFAIHNSLGGLVQESFLAAASHKFKVRKQFGILISHHLMIRNDQCEDEISIVMSHPESFAQCKQTLASKYPHLKQVSGTGNLIDNGAIAKALSDNKLPRNTAVIGSKVLAEIYGLRILASDLQDANNNITTFAIVSR